MNRRVAAALICALLLASCSRSSSGQATVDGGTPDVALLGDTIVTAAGGDTITIVHGSEPQTDAENPVNHAFVAPAADGALPPLFVPRGGGLAPNAGVWGACRGGDVAEAVDGCPIPPIEGPQAWDGRSYWSTGAMLPGEEREVPLGDDIAPGDHPMVCALHPGLRVVVRVDAAAPDAPTRDVEAEVAAARAFAAEADPHQGPTQVNAGVAAPNAYVAVFAPETLRISAGETVTWRATGRAPVDVVFGASEEQLDLSHAQPADALPKGNPSAYAGKGLLQSGFLSADRTAGASGSSWAVTFPRPGPYRYASRFSATLQGMVIVE